MKLTGIGNLGFQSLDDILADSSSMDFFESVKPKDQPLTSDSKLLAKFRDIESFYLTHNRAPSTEGDLKEKALNRSLIALRNHADFVQSIQGHDRFGLISGRQPDSDEPGLSDNFDLDQVEVVAQSNQEIDIPVFNSLDDILDFEGGELLGDLGDVSIYEAQTRTSTNNGAPYADEMSGSRFQCVDFWKYEPHFDKIKLSLKDGSATFNKLQTEQNLFVGDIFLLNGILCFIAAKYLEERKSERKNYRLKLIFENGLESNMLMRSLARAIYKDENGRQILMNDENSLAQMFSETIESLPSGNIYIAKLDQVKPELAHFQNLYKVGFTRGNVEDRLHGCEDDIAFLESKVHVVAKIECKNMNPHSFEQMIHAFLYAQRLNMMLKSKNGQTYKPREWFAVDLETILEIAQRIIDQSIVRYRMDNTTGKIVSK